MDFEFEHALSAEVVEQGGLRQAILHISDDSYWTDSPSLEALGRRWESVHEEYTDNRNEENTTLQYTQVEETLEVIVVHEYPDGHTRKSLGKRFSSIAKSLTSNAAIHIGRFGGPRTKGLGWSDVEQCLKKHFLDRGIPVTIHDQIYRAIDDGDVEAVEAMIDCGVDINETYGDHSFTPLAWALQSSGHSYLEDAPIQIVRLLIASGATTNGLLSDVINANRYSRGGFAWLVERLIETGEPGDALCYASDIEVAEKLIARGADVNAKDEEKISPLHIAARLATLAYVTFLVEQGADANAKDSEGKTPLDYAIGSGKKKVIKYLKGVMGIPIRTKKETEAYLENKIFEEALLAINAFAKKHKKKHFYGFAFDCNAEEDGHLGFCFSSPVPKDVDAKTLDWCVGSWSHQAFEEKDYFRDGLSAKKYLDLLARVAIRLHEEDGFKRIQRIDGFQSYVMNHDETEKQAFRRMNRVRKAVGTSI